MTCRRPKCLREDEQERFWIFHFSTREKLEGADHFCRLALGAASMPDSIGFPGLAQRQIEWYLDAFFFELVSAYEVLLQELNVLYCAGFKVREVRWGSDERRENLQDRLPSRLRKRMEEERKTDWFKRVRWCRNTTTHHQLIPRSVIWERFGEKPWNVKGPKVNILCYDANTKEPRTENIEICTYYLNSMLDHIHAVWKKMAESFD